jgi:hypothetical protein
LLNKQLANGNRVIAQQETQAAPMDSANGVFGANPTMPLGQAFEFQYPQPGIVVAANATVAIASQQFINQIGVGYLQGTAKATVTCTWSSAL